MNVRQQGVAPFSISPEGQVLINTIQNTAEQAINRIQGIMSSVGQTISRLNDLWAEQLMPLTTYRYLELDSTYRNRTLYPNPASFVVPYNNGANGYNTLTSQDPVSLAYPYATGTTQAGSTTTDIVLSTTASTLANFYVGNTLSISGQNTVVSFYSGAAQTAVVSPALSAAPGAGTYYELRYEGIPVATGTLQAGSTQTQIVLPASFSSTDDYYQGMFVYFDSGVDQGLSRVIGAYNGTTKVATLTQSLLTAPGTDEIEILPFSYDNAISLRYSGSRTLNQPVCYAIQLLTLSIPNQTLSVGYGGTVANYPYLYVHVYNEIKHTETTLYGNNPNGALATFRVGTDSLVQDTVLDGSPIWFCYKEIIAVLCPQTFKFSPHESLRFRLTLPNGEDVAFVTADSTSPSPPNPLLQISALLALKMIALTPTVARA